MVDEKEKIINNGNYQKLIDNIINLNLKIEIRIFSRLKFQDSKIENHFQEYNQKNSRIIKILSDIVIFNGYIASLLYIIFAFYRIEFFLICLIFNTLSIIFAIFTYFLKNKRLVMIFEQINIFLIAISLFIKCLVVNFKYNTENNDHESELVRIIIYFFVSTCLFIFLKNEANIYIYLFYYFLNLIMIIISSFKSNKNNFYFLEGFTAFLLYLIFFGFRLVFDYLKRMIFAEKFRFERYYQYMSNFIRGLNCFHLNFKNEEMLYMDQKFQEFINNNICDMNFNRTSDINMSESTINNELIKMKLSNGSFNNFLKYIVPSNEEFLENNIDLFDENNTNFIEKEEEKSHGIFSQEINHQNNNKNLFNYLKKMKDKKNTLNKFYKIGIFNFNCSQMQKYYEVFYRRISLENENNYYDLLFYDVSDLIISKKIIHEENIIKQKILAKIAHEFKTPINSIIGLINNIKEDTLKEKNEFNLSANGTSRKNYTSMKKLKITEKKNQQIDMIHNLSKYVIFLVSDIIQYCNIKDINHLNVSLETVKVKSLATFTFEILKCLLKCNKSKSENIKAELSYDEKINEFNLISDEIRLKQILLNIISNSVKFTKRGKISITFNLDGDENLLISISDTGIGVKNEDKEKLFKDFVKLENSSNLNTQGSGLGLSICRSLTKILKANFTFDSKYGEGSIFTLLLKINKEIKSFKTIIGASDIIICDVFNKRIGGISSIKNEFKQGQKISSNTILKIKKTPSFNINPIRDFNFKNEIIQRENSLNLAFEEESLRKTKLITQNIFYINKIKNISYLNYENNSFKSSDSVSFKNHTNFRMINNILKRNRKKIITGYSSVSSFSNMTKDLKNSESVKDRKNKIFVKQESSHSSNSNKTLTGKQNMKNSKLKILIVDDNKFINDSIKSLIDSIIKEFNPNYETIQAYDGIDILNLIIEDQKEDNFIKCVLTDENMEYLNGSEAIKILRNLEKKNKIQNLKYFSITGNEDNSSVRNILECGVNQVFCKPISRDLIKKCLLDLFNTN